jgi:tyrosyl-tRNA synthetase
VNKMSKSLGNAIGIHEPPLEMYGKVMSISDEMMWRYYELLTDVRSDQIEQMKADAASGKQHPMALKKELARSIVADFHSADASTKAAEDWAKQFQKDLVPEDLEFVEIRSTDVKPIRSTDVMPTGRGGAAVRVIGGIGQPAETELVRIDKLIRLAGLAASNTEAAGMVKQGAVNIGDEKIDQSEVLVMIPAGKEVPLRVGRKMKKIRVISDGGR